MEAEMQRNERPFFPITWAFWPLFLALSLGCGSNGSTAKPGGDGSGDGTDPGKCPIDSSMEGNTDPDWQLVAGQEKTGYICPAKDVDHYWFQVDVPNTIVEVTLRNNVTLSPVDLCYTVLSSAASAPSLGGVCDPDGTDGVTEIHGAHFLANTGVYFLQVRDENGDDTDPRNPYRLSLDLRSDPDPYEPNNDSAHASVLTANKGFISFLGDADWYQVQVSAAGQLLSVDLANDKASPVDLQVTVYKPDGTSALQMAKDTNGSDGKTAIHDVVSLPAAGLYLLQVRDINDDGVDLETGYTLTTSLQQNPDPRDRASPNNTWDTATALSSGAIISDAYLASRADEDWYVLDNPNNPGLIEVDLQMTDLNSPVDPAIDLIVPDAATPCTSASACTELTTAPLCTAGCTTAECKNAKCPSHECLANGKCRGAGICLTGLCGVRLVTLHGASWSRSNPQNASLLHTVAPVHASKVYVVVRDFQADAQDLLHPYKLTVTLRPEPDANEAGAGNGLWLPYATNDQEEETTRWNQSLAGALTGSGAGPITWNVDGYLSYRGDQDWYVFEIPRVDKALPAAAAASCTTSANCNSDPSKCYYRCTAGLCVPADPVDNKGDWQVTFAYNYGGLVQEINYTVVYGVDMGWEANPGSSVFGDNECAYICGEYQFSAQETTKKMYFRVQHRSRTDYDYASPYHVTVTATQNCPSQCSYCQAGQTSFPCPNPNNVAPGNKCN